jgi:DNA-binding NarL/FixJ family response regulator
MSDKMSDRIRLLIADDHALFREGLRALLMAVPDLELVGEAASGEEAIAETERLQPEVVLMDLKMPGMSGIEATRRILARNASVGVVVVTMLEDDASVFSAMRAGARGYVLKGAHHDALLQAIRAVAEGQALFGPAVATRMMSYFQSLGTGVKSSGEALIFPELTQREREVLGLIATGINNAEIAERLEISTKTVRNHINSIFSKLHLADRAQAIVRARDAGLGRSEAVS